MSRSGTATPSACIAGAPHIHLKVHIGGSVVHTARSSSQKTTIAVYPHPYKSPAAHHHPT